MQAKGEEGQYTSVDKEWVACFDDRTNGSVWISVTNARTSTHVNGPQCNQSITGGVATKKTEVNQDYQKVSSWMRSIICFLVASQIRHTKCVGKKDLNKGYQSNQKREFHWLVDTTNENEGQRKLRKVDSWRLSESGIESALPSRGYK